MDVRTGTASVDGLRMHYQVAGAGPVVVLLHGWPQTSHCWRLVQPAIAAAGYTALAPDLRGYGLTDKPPGGYDKRTMAGDIRGLVTALGFDTVRLVGHDRGARVAHRYALDHPTEVTHLAVLDIAPTLTVVEEGTLRASLGYWHWLFHQQPDLPELLVGPATGAYLRYFFERWTVQRQPLAEAADHYVEAFSRPGALRAGFDDYRATEQDVTEDAASRDRGEKLPMPVLALWGDQGLPARSPMLDIWSRYATDVTGEAVPDCGHFVPEEQPDRLLEILIPFLGR
jgi:haloacetate dehalogenase